MMLRLTTLVSASAQRPPGYLDAVLFAGRRVGDWVWLSPAAWARLRRTYLVTLPEDQWPDWAIVISRLRTPLERGVGDTLARIIGRMGGAAFKRWFKATFKRSCGCTQRQEDFNRQFPYQNPL